MSEYKCWTCEDGELLNTHYALYAIDLTDGMIEIDGDTVTITMNDRLECDDCGLTKEVIAYAKIHTWEVHGE